MTALSQINQGSRILAALLRGIAPLAAYKSVDEPAMSPVGTLQPDDALLLNLAPDAVYVFALSASCTGGAAGSSDLMAGWSFPSGATMVYGRLGIPATGTTAGTFGFLKTIQSDVVNYQTAGGTGTSDFLNIGTIATSGTPGMLQFLWCQNSGPATPTLVKAGSALLAWQIQ